jgi:lipoate-protein ligase A
VLPVWDLSRPDPAGNLAADEALLDWCDEAEGRGALRFWESPVHFVVLGYGNRAAQEVRLDACRAADVPVLRRCSGGGTVLQGPGCLNYSLALPIADDPQLESISAANRFIMARNQAALEEVLGKPVTVEGFTDLVVAGRKFSGNAQRRKRRSLLFHGTFLVSLDLTLVERLLLIPPRQPDYRRGRGHREFIENVPADRESVKAAMRRAWNAEEKFCPSISDRIEHLVRERYGRDDWNLRVDSAGT